MMRNYIMENHPPPVMCWDQYQEIVSSEWKSILDSQECTEKHVQETLEKHPCLIPGAFGLLHQSGHWPYPGAVITQPVLPDFTRRIPDFLWIATDSGNVRVILLEIESPRKKWFTRRGIQTAELTQAFDQIVEWKRWFNNPLNVEQFKSYYLFPDWLRERAMKQLYILIYGRRGEFAADPALNRKRAYLQPEDVIVMTFDRLAPESSCSNLMTVTIERDGFHCLHVPPTLTLSPGTAGIRGVIRGKEDAVLRNQYLCNERKQFLCRRIPYWDAFAKGPSGIIKSDDFE